MDALHYLRVTKCGTTLRDYAKEHIASSLHKVKYYHIIFLLARREGYYGPFERVLHVKRVK